MRPIEPDQPLVIDFDGDGRKPSLLLLTRPSDGGLSTSAYLFGGICPEPVSVPISSASTRTLRRPDKQVAEGGRSRLVKEEKINRSQKKNSGPFASARHQHLWPARVRRVSHSTLKRPLTRSTASSHLRMRLWSSTAGFASVSGPAAFLISTPALPTVSVQVLELERRSAIRMPSSSLKAQACPGPASRLWWLTTTRRPTALSTFVREAYPRVGVFGLEASLRTLAAYNAAIRSSASEFVAAAEQRTRACGCAWLADWSLPRSGTMRSPSPRRFCDWAGETVDFAGGATSFVGQSWAPTLASRRRVPTSRSRCFFRAPDAALSLARRSWRPEVLTRIS